MGSGHISVSEDGRWRVMMSGEKNENAFDVLREVIASFKNGSDSFVDAAALESD